MLARRSRNVHQRSETVPARRPARVRRPENPAGVITRSGIHAPGFASPRPGGPSGLAAHAGGGEETIELGPGGCAFVTLGSVTADSSDFGISAAVSGPTVVVDANHISSSGTVAAYVYVNV